MGRLHELGLKHGTDKATYHGYCDFYEEHLPIPHPVRRLRLLEIGVKDGASLKMWRDYYPLAEVVGMDIAPAIEVEGCTVLQMDATDVFMLKSLGNFDIIIDDGSHMTKDQQITFTRLYYRQLVPGGWYIMEDVHTSHWPQYRNSGLDTYHELITRFGNDALVWSRTADHSDSVTMMIRKR